MRETNEDGKGEQASGSEYKWREREDKSILGHDTQAPSLMQCKRAVFAATVRGTGDEDYKLCGRLKRL